MNEKTLQPCPFCGGRVKMEERMSNGGLEFKDGR